MPERALILYDGDCAFCVSSVRQLQRLDWRGRLAFGDARDDGVRLPEIELERALRRMHVVTPAGQILDGFFAFRCLAGRLPALWPLWPLLWLPGVAPLGVRVYDLVARNRRVFGVCEGGACGVGEPRESGRRVSR